MILMQRLVTSSTAAIRATLEKRQALLNMTQDQPQISLFEAVNADEWTELDGQSQVDIALQASGWEQEKAEVDMLLELARTTESQGTDSKAEALLDLIYRLQQEESNPALKVLIFTEFVATQAMLTSFLDGRGFSIALLNGGMDLDERTKSQQAFSRTSQILISTDAGGEGLNLQFCHVIINFDMPWNPMRIEQRIGRVDRIGQQHIVRAFNFVLEDTVEHRVRQVLEQKLEIIAQEFGVDKAFDVMDSAEADPIFDELFVQGLQNPGSIEKDCDVVISKVREKIADSKNTSQLLADVHDLNADDARKWRDHPAQFWLERAITSGLSAHGGAAVKTSDGWNIKWWNDTQSDGVCFDARTAEHNPGLEWITLEDPRARAVISELPRSVPGLPAPLVLISGLPETVVGVWSLWEINLSGDGFSHKRFLPIFLNDDGRTFLPTAQRIWDLLLTADVKITGSSTSTEAKLWYEDSISAAVTHGERLLSELLSNHKNNIKDQRERAIYAYEARLQAISRVGLPAVKEYRRKRLTADHNVKMQKLDSAAVSMPDLNAVMVLRIGSASK